jgi:hypothetical protein
LPATRVIDRTACDEPDRVDKIGVVLAWVFIGGGPIAIVVVLLLYLASAAGRPPF